MHSRLAFMFRLKTHWLNVKMEIVAVGMVLVPEQTEELGRRCQTRWWARCRGTEHWLLLFARSCAREAAAVVVVRPEAACL